MATECCVPARLSLSVQDESFVSMVERAPVTFEQLNCELGNSARTRRMASVSAANTRQA